MPNLGDLPHDHVLRNTPLIKIGATYQFKGTKGSFAVLPSWTIAKNTFNELGPAWTANQIWRGDLPDGTDDRSEGIR